MISIYLGEEMIYFKRRNFNQRGFTLIELLLVLGIATIAALALIAKAKKESEAMQAEVLAGQFEEVGTATGASIYRNYANLINNTASPANGGACFTAAGLPVSGALNPLGPLGAFPVRNCNITIADLVTMGLLPASYVNKVLIPQVGAAVPQFNIQLNSRVVAGNNIVSGLVVSSLPWVSDSAQPRFDLLGRAIGKIGSLGGMTFAANNVVNGYGGVWSLTVNDFPVLNTLPAQGKIAYRTYFGNATAYDSIYLRRDGTLPMLGNLQMGGNSILMQGGSITGGNATNAIPPAGTFADFFNLFARNNVTTPRINNVDYPDGTVAPEVTAFGNSTSAPPLALRPVGTTAGNGMVSIKDAWVTDVRGSGSWLSERLPKYSSRGVFSSVHNQLVPKPNDCGSGTPRLEVIPQVSYTQGRVAGTITTTIAPVSTGGYSLTTASNQYSVGANITYAVNNGLTWRVQNYTVDYSGGVYATDGSVVAHTYCDYGT